MATAPSKETAGEAEERMTCPFLRRVRIQGYKSIAFCDVELQPLTILVGRNAAGKSNFLDALAFLRDVMDTSVTEAVKRRGGWSAIACRAKKLPKIAFQVEAGFTCGPPYRRFLGNGASSWPLSGEDAVPNVEGHSFVATYTVELTTDAHSLPKIAREELEFLNQTAKVKARIESKEGIIERERSTPNSAPLLPLPNSRDLAALARPDLLLLSVIGTQPSIDLAEGLRFMSFYNFHPEAVRSVQKPLLGAMLEKDGSNLASVIEGLKEIDPDSIQRVREYLSTIAKEIEGFDVARYGEYETVRFRLRSGTGESPLEFDAASMSDGTLRALAGLMAAFQIVLPYGHPSVIGIEEPEASLHPAAVRALVAALQEATGHTQVLLTTHNGDLLSAPEIDPCQVLVVRNHRGQTQIAPVDAASREIVHKELYTLADLQRMDQLEPDRADLERQAAEQPKGGAD